MRTAAALEDSEPFGWWKFGLFTALAVVFGGAAALVLPDSDSPGPVLAPVVVEIPSQVVDQEGSLGVVTVDVDEWHGDSGVRLSVTAEFNREARGSAQVRLLVSLPFGAGAISSCEAAAGADVPRCTIIRSNSHGLPDELAIDGQMSSRHRLGELPDAGENGSIFEAHVFLSDTSGVGFRDNHSKVLVNLPSVYDAMPVQHAVPVNVTYHIPGLDRLSWSGTQPTNCCEEDEARWRYSSHIASPPPGPVIALKEGVADADSSQTFVAGALFGLGSAAVLEALGEVVAVLDKGRAIRRRARGKSIWVGTLRRGG